MKNCVILITDNGNITQKIKKSLLLLRENDSFESIRIKNCFDTIKDKKPSIIFYHYAENKNFEENYKINQIDFVQNLLAKIKQNPFLKNTAIILLYEQIDEESLCTFFESGITDFLPTYSTETELTIRTIWCLQKRELLNNCQNKIDILSQLNIIDKKNNVFTENYTHKILKEESEKTWGTFVSLAPDINIRSKIAPSALMNAIKSIVRTNDILGYASNFKIYLWFRETKQNDVLSILKKLKKLLSENFPICAGYIELHDIGFDTAEEIANRALSKALLNGNTFICAKESDKKEKDEDDIITNYKQYKDNFSKKLESLLSPLFFQTQKRMEEKLFQTKITQNVNKEKSVFSLETENIKGVFWVSYSGFTKIKIQQKIQINNEAVSQKKLFFESEDLTDKKIENILNKFIEEFKEKSNT